MVDSLECPSASTSEEQSLCSYTSESFDDNDSIVTVIRLVNDAVDDIESEVSNLGSKKQQQWNSPACHRLQSKNKIFIEFFKEYTVDSYQWETSFHASSWLSPSRLCPPTLGSRYDLSDAQPTIRREGSTRSLQLDSRMVDYDCDSGHEWRQESRRSTFQWERNCSGAWERKQSVHSEERRRHEKGGKNGTRRRDVGDYLDVHGTNSFEDSSSPVYEEFRESSHDMAQTENTDNLYDTLPPTRRAYEGYLPSPPSLSLHPAQLIPPLRTWNLQPEEMRGLQEGQGELRSGGLAGSEEELERLLNLVSIRARRATRLNRTSTGSEPAADWDGFK